MSWFLLALLAPLIYAVVNLVDDNLLRHIYKGPRLAAAVSGLFGALPLVSLLWVEWSPIPNSYAAMMLLAGILTAFYYYHYFRALGLESPSVVVAMFSLVPATLPILAFFFVGERLSGMQFFGFFLILLASFALALTDVRKFKFWKALVPVLWVVLFSDIVVILTKYVYERAEFYPAFMFFAAGLGLAGVYFALRVFFERSKHDLSLFKRKLVKLVPILIAVELLGVAAEFTTNLAISRGPVSLVNVLEGLQPIFVLLIAVLFYPVAPHLFREASEGKLAKKFTCMAIILGGLGVIWASV